MKARFNFNKPFRLPGAGADFQTATAIATAMVKKFGMSEKVSRGVDCPSPSSAVPFHHLPVGVELEERRCRVCNYRIGQRRKFHEI